VLLEHCCLPSLSSPFSPVAFKVVALLLAEFSTTALPNAQHEWPIVTMLLGETQLDALALLHHWLRAVGVRTSKYPTRIQQAFLGLAPVYALPRSLHILLIFYMFSQEALPPL
jgi:hypothetical protein